MYRRENSQPYSIAVMIIYVGTVKAAFQFDFMLLLAEFLSIL